MNEEWRAVQGYEGYYEVSDLGNVRRIAPWSDKRARQLKPTMKVTIHHGGYAVVTLSKNAKQKVHNVHRLVCEAFYGKFPEPGHASEVNHKNGIKCDNRLSNLEVVTPSENHIHAEYVLGFWRKRMRGSAHANSKITESDVIEMRSLKGLVSPADLAQRFGLHKSTVNAILSNRAWQHVL